MLLYLSRKTFYRYLTIDRQRSGVAEHIDLTFSHFTDKQMLIQFQSHL